MSWQEIVLVVWTVLTFGNLVRHGVRLSLGEPGSEQAFAEWAFITGVGMVSVVLILLFWPGT